MRPLQTIMTHQRQSILFELLLKNFIGYVPWPACTVWIIKRVNKGPFFCKGKFWAAFADASKVSPTNLYRYIVPTSKNRTWPIFLLRCCNRQWRWSLESSFHYKYKQPLRVLSQIHHPTLTLFFESWEIAKYAHESWTTNTLGVFSK